MGALVIMNFLFSCYNDFSTLLRQAGSKNEVTDGSTLEVEYYLICTHSMTSKVQKKCHSKQFKIEVHVVYLSILQKNVLFEVAYIFG